MDYPEEEKVCCICKKIFYGYGNNVYPLYDDGICCYECNLEYVIPARIQQQNNK